MGSGRLITILGALEVSEKRNLANWNAGSDALGSTIYGLLLKEVAPGWTVGDIQALTEPKLVAAEDIKEVEL